HSCGAPVPRLITGETQQFGCYGCLRNLRFTITKGTELGMIRYVDAVRGVTFGIPGLTRTDFELVPQGDKGWVGARVPQEQMMELLRTPTYRTIQQDEWLFCCGSAMTFCGQWSQKDYRDNAPDGNGEALFERIVRGKLQGPLKDLLDAGMGIYVFYCRKCEEYRAHWDFD